MLALGVTQPGVGSVTRYYWRALTSWCWFAARPEHGPDRRHLCQGGSSRSSWGWRKAQTIGFPSLILCKIILSYETTLWNHCLLCCSAGGFFCQQRHVWASASNAGSSPMQQLPHLCDQLDSPTEHLQSGAACVAELTQYHCSHPRLQSGSSVAIHLPLFGINV